MLLSLKFEVCCHVVMCYASLILPLGLAEIEGIKRQGQLKTNSPFTTTIFNDIAINNTLMYKKTGNIIYVCLVTPANDKANKNRIKS